MPPPADLPNKVKLLILFFFIIILISFAKLTRNFSFILYCSLISLIPSIILVDSFFILSSKKIKYNILYLFFIISKLLLIVKTLLKN